MENKWLDAWDEAYKAISAMEKRGRRLHAEKEALTKQIVDLTEENARLNREIAEKPSPFFSGLAEGRKQAEKRIAALEEENRKLLAGQFPEVAERIQALTEENIHLREMLHDEERRQERIWEERTQSLRAELNGWRDAFEKIVSLRAKIAILQSPVYILDAKGIDTEKIAATGKITHEES